MQEKLRYSGFLLALSLTACAPQPTLMQDPAPIAANEKLQSVAAIQKESQQIQAFEIRGAMAARDQKKSWTASVNWRQSGASHYQIRLFGPLGSGTVLIERQGGAVRLQDGPRIVSAKNAEQLMQKETGVSFPVGNFYYWIRALAAPGKANISRDANNRMQRLQQAGYTIDYLSYMKTRHGYLPSSLRLQGNGILVKLLIKQWQ